MIVTCLRGVGKTVLLGEFRNIALGADWVVVEMEVSKHDDDRFRNDIASKLAIALLELSPKAPTIGVLSGSDARLALTEPAAEKGVEFTDEALDFALTMTGRYPYFLQELRYAVWGVAESSPITASDIRDASAIYEAKLDSSFFRVRLDRCSELQRAYLRAMADLGPAPRKAAEVARLLNRESTQVAPTRSELVSMGLLYTPDHGYAAFTVPHFDLFMKRTIPKLEVPPIRRRKPRSANEGSAPTQGSTD